MSRFNISSTVAGFFSSRWNVEQRVAVLFAPNRNTTTRLSRRGTCVVFGVVLVAVGLAGQSSVTLGVDEPQVTPTQVPNPAPTGESPTNQSDASSAPFSGTVRNSQKSPAKHATVILSYRERDDRELQYSVTKTDSSGDYRFDDLSIPPSAMGYHSLMAYLPDHAFVRRSTYINQAEAATSTEPVTVNFSLVEADDNFIVIVDEQGDPVPGAKLELLNTNGDVGSNLWIQNREWDLCGIKHPVSDEDGRMNIPGIDRTRSYDLRISHPEYAETPLWNVTFQREPKTVVIEKGAKVRFEVSCESDPHAVAQAKIEVTVSEDGGHSVLVFDVDSSGRIETRLRDRHSTVHINHPSLEGLPWYFYDVDDSVMTFRLYPTGQVKGRVVDPETGRGVAEVGVRFVRENRVIKHVRTDAEGNYQCELAATSYDGSVDQSSGRWESSEQPLSFDVIASGSVTLDDLTAKAESKIRGRVVTESGQSVRNAIVVQSFRRDAILTDEEGMFELEPQRSTSYPIQVLHPNEKLSRVVASPSDGEMLTIRLTAEGVLTGVLRDGSGKTLPYLEAGLGVMFNRSGRRTGGGLSTVLETLQTDDQGFVRFVGLSEGLGYRLAVGRRMLTGSSNRNEAKSPIFYLPDLPSVPVEIEVDSQLQSELKNRSTLQTASETLLPFGAVKWSGQKEFDVESFGGQWLLVATASHPQQFAQSELALQLYGDQGVKVVGVLSSLMSKLQGDDQAAQEYSFPVAIDNDEARIMGRYGHSNLGDVLVYNAQGELVRSVHRGRNLLPIVRNLVLYGE